MSISRRAFVQSAAALLATGCARPRSAGFLVHDAGLSHEARLPLGFSTLGCPGWDWQRILDFAQAHRFGAVELRGIGTQMDLPLLPTLQPAQLAQTRRELAAHDLVVSCLGSSTNLHEMEPAKHEAELAHARRFIDLAQALGAPWVRVFGNKYVAGVPRDQMLAHIAAGLRTLGDYAKERGVTILLESHGDFVDSPTLVELMRRADGPGVALLWDAHHTFAFGKEEPEATLIAIKSHVRHVHLKDSVPAGADRRYVLTGTGDVPVGRQIAALAKSGYRGVYSFEWEKRWHPEIEEPEVAFPQFADFATRYLRQAGVSAGA
ncbi:MAG: sugar phosphate isomerase/epimerase [Gemmatimonadota bacterium]|nr:sugar phosphate isomerase/epimerase [Gemmatimonadota bacterium]